MCSRVGLCLRDRCGALSETGFLPVLGGVPLAGRWPASGEHVVQVGGDLGADVAAFQLREQAAVDGGGAEDGAEQVA